MSIVNSGPRATALYLGLSLAFSSGLSSCTKETRSPLIQTAAELRTNVGAKVQLDARGSFDPQDLPLTFEWTFRALPSGSRATLNDPRVQNPTFVADVPGTFTLELALSNGLAAVVKTTVNVIVSPCGTQAPSIAAVAVLPAVPSVGDEIQLLASVDDADVTGECRLPARFTYEWSFVALPTGSRARLNDVGVRNPSFVTDVPGDYTVRVVAGDESGNKSPPFLQSFAVLACGSGVPVATPRFSPDLPATGDIVQLDVAAQDPDTLPACGRVETYSYEWTLLAAPAGSRAALNGGTLRNPWFLVDAAGDYLARVVVSDAAGHRSAPALATVRAGGCGGATPVASIVAPSNGNVSAVISLGAIVSDADALPPCSRNERFTYAWSFEQVPAGSTARMSDTALAAPAFTPDIPGNYVVRLVTADLVGHQSAPATASITISACGGNRPSATVRATPAPASVGDTVVLTPTVVDGDIACGIAESFRFAWSFDGLPAGSAATFNNDTLGSPSFTPDIAGLYSLRLVVTDSTGRSSAPVITTVTVAACGANSPVASISVGAGAARIGLPVSLTATTVDADNESPCNLGQRFTHRWSFDSLPAGSAATFNSPTARTPSFTPDLAGTYVVTLVTEDSTGRQSDPALATVVVSPCGGSRPSVTSVSASTIAPNVGQAVILNARFDDLDNGLSCGLSQTFSYRWSLTAVPTGSGTTLGDSTALNPTMRPDVAGTYTLQFIVVDSTGLSSAPATLTVTASACGGAVPVVGVVTPSSSAPNVGQVVRLTAAVSDADNGAGCALGQALNYRWSFAQLPSGSGAAFNAASAETPSFTPDVPGAYIVELLVTDSTGRSSARSLSTITASTCGSNRPTATIEVASPFFDAVSPAIVARGATVQFDAASSDDADNRSPCNLGQPLSFQWELLAKPAGSSATLDSSTLRTPSLRVNEDGVYSVRLRVFDGQRLSDYAKFDVFACAPFPACATP